MSYIKLYRDSSLSNYSTLQIGDISGNTIAGQLTTATSIGGGTIHGNTIPSMSGNNTIFNSDLNYDSHGTDLSYFISNASDTIWYLTASKTIKFLSNSNGKCYGFQIFEGSTQLYGVYSGLINEVTNSEIVFVNGSALKPEEQLYICVYAGPWIGPISGTGWGVTYGGARNMLQTVLHESGTNFNDLWNSKSLILGDNVNPYSGGEYSGTGGGDRHKQNWSENSDIVLPSPMPSETDYGAVACGLITIFTPSKDQLKKLSEVIWGQGFWNFVKNAIENIADLFVSLAMVPFEVSKGETVEVTWFSYDLGGQVPIGTGIYLTKATKQWYEFDMGTINLMGSGKGFATDSVLDYSPYSKLGIYLPFIGYQELDIDECREAPINLLYRIDILSGTCVALITINGRTIYQFTGNCITQLPLTSMDAQTMLSNAVNIGIAAASAGATAAVASAGDAVAAENLAKGKISAAGAELQNAQHSASVSNAQGSLVSATANGVLGMKPNFKKSGAISASASLFNVMQPYLFLTTPRQSMPEGYQNVCGFPCNIGDVLGNFEGFTVVEDIRLNGLVATSPEVEEIYQLLKTGVII